MLVIGAKNSYEEALVDVGVVLSRYDEDNNYAVFGFGGQPGKLSLSKSQTTTPRMDEIVEDIAAEKPVETPVEEPVEEPDDGPAEIPVETPVEEPANGPAEGPAETPVETPVEEPAEGPAEIPVETPVEEPANGPAEESATKDSSSVSSTESRSHSVHSPQENVGMEKEEEEKTDEEEKEKEKPQTEEASCTSIKTLYNESDLLYHSIDLRNKKLPSMSRSTFTRPLFLFSLIP